MKNNDELFQNDNTKKLGITIAQQKENAKLCGDTLEEYQKSMNPHYEVMVKILAAEQYQKDNPDYNPYEGWTQEEIDHYEDKFFHQPFDANEAKSKAEYAQRKEDRQLTAQEISDEYDSENPAAKFEAMFP